jgi:hypothetical protein
MAVVHDTPERHNWLTRLVDAIAFYDRTRRRWRESMLGRYVSDLRRSRRERKLRTSR